MVPNFIDPFLNYLLEVDYYHQSWGYEVGEVQACISELRFLKMCVCWFSRYDKNDCSEENLEYLESMLYTLESTWEHLVAILDETLDAFEEEKNLRKHTETFSMKSFERIPEEEEEVAIRSGMEYKGQDGYVAWLTKEAVPHWNLWSSHFQITIEESKLYVRRYCPYMLHCRFNHSCTSNADQILIFLDAILLNLKGNLMLKKQIETFEGNLMLLQAVIKLIPDDCVSELRDFKEGLYNDINKLAWVTFFFWAKAEDKDIPAELNLMLSGMSLKIINPSVSDVPNFYFRGLKAMRLQHSDDTLLLGQAVPGFLDLLFEYLEVPFNEDFQVFRDGLITLFTFLANPHAEGCAEDEVFSLIHGQFGDFLRQGSCLREKDSPEKEVRLRDFMTQIENLKGKIKKMHNLIPDSSSYTFPRTSGLGFIDCLLQKLKECLNREKLFIPFAKHLIMKIEQELVSLRPTLNDIFDLQKEHKELQNTRLRLINLAYLTEHVVNSCSVVLYPIWYNMVSLADILDEIKLIKEKIDTVKHTNFDIDAVLPKLVGSNVEIPTGDRYSGASEVMIGCDEEVDTIVDQLTWGPKSLEIVSIVGMGGSGKTTLARKVCDTQQVRSSFHISAFCTVSQVYSARSVLIHILKEIKKVVDKIDSKTDDDLGHLLKQQLSGKRYIVVMDDVWNIDAWEKLKSSFPDNNNGSRIIFTTRESDVAMKAKSKFSPHSKRLLSDEESWELLKTKAFLKGSSPPNLTKVGKVIARNCKGMPLAVVLIARLLKREKRSLTLWDEIARDTVSFASEEGCMKVLELSYKHLPGPLKSCFLYFGVFVEDEKIPAKRIMLLWVAEGFVQKTQRESVGIVAKRYLSELVDRSLVQLAKRSSSNGIKTCQVHDIIRDFCQRKAQEENFLRLINGVAAFNSSHFNQYRVCMNKECWKLFVDAEVTAPGIKSLIYHDKSVFIYGCECSKLNLSKLQLIQVLDLEKVELSGSTSEINRILESIGSLVHLIYLALSMPQRYSEDFKVLPCMPNLKNLESCIIRGNASWPGQSFWKMERLRHVDIGKCRVSLNQSNLDAYPPLDNLESFSRVFITPQTAMALLHRLPNVRKLNCYGVDLFCGRWNLAFDILIKLESLKLSVGYNLHVIFPDTLKKLSLHGCSLYQHLGKLPCLEVLKIHGSRELTWDIEEGEFPELKFLKLQYLMLREWNVSADSFPLLQQIVVEDCYYLDEMPALFRESTTLERIEVYNCSPSLERSACEIREEQRDLGNEIQLIHRR